MVKTATTTHLTDKVLEDVKEHRQVQLGVWGIQHNTPEMWQLIAQEEFGEIADAIQTHYRTPTGENYAKIYEETIQTIAVLTAFAESMVTQNPNIKMPDYNVEQLRKERGLE